MNDLTSHLLLYGNLAQGGTILASMAEIYADWKAHSCTKPLLVQRIFR